MSQLTERLKAATAATVRTGAATFFAAALTLAFFLVLPIMQHVARPPESDLDLRTVGTVNLPPPPPPPPPEAEEEKPQEAPPPELSEEAPPLDLSQLELALNPGFGGMGGADFGIKLSVLEGASDEQAESIFSMAELDQTPRVVHQPAPEYPSELRRKKIEGTVYVLFVVDRAGRVVDPMVQKATHPAFERPALQAVRRWRFEPGKRNGEPVQFKMRVPITFAAG